MTKIIQTEWIHSIMNSDPQQAPAQDAYWGTEGVVYDSKGYIYVMYDLARSVDTANEGKLFLQKWEIQPDGTTNLVLEVEIFDYNHQSSFEYNPSCLGLGRPLLFLLAVQEVRADGRLPAESLIFCLGGH